MQPFRFGAYVSGGGIQAFRYDDHYCNVPERKCLSVAPKDQQAALMLALAEQFPTPYTLGYALVEPTEGARMGSYVRREPMDLPALQGWMEEFGPFLEQDARHNFWIIGHGGESSLFYDQHDIIYLRGDLEHFRPLLKEWGLTEGPVELPYPHTHHSFPEWDEAMQRLLTSGPWEMVPKIDV